MKTVRSARGSSFFLCGLAFVKPGMPKYPPQPVRNCAGFATSFQKENV